jgi:hypothetical protein
MQAHTRACTISPLVMTVIDKRMMPPCIELLSQGILSQCHDSDLRF